MVFYPWGHDRPYNDFASFIKRRFGERVQKLSIHAGFSCPNRDGTIGTGGCTYCNNHTFKPDYCEPVLPIREQLEKGRAFFSRRYPGQKYIAYFQSYTNTYGEDDSLINLYEEALSLPWIVGLVVGTRPDCISDVLLEYFTELAKKQFVGIELGVESIHNRTLQRINRGHTFEQVQEAAERVRSRNIHLGGHFIVGLPDETVGDILSYTTAINALPFDVIKLHQLQIIKGTAMAKEFESFPERFHLFEVDSYIDLVIQFLERLDPRIIVERFVSESKPDLLVAPHWGMKNFEIVNQLVNMMIERKTWQGRLVE